MSADARSVVVGRPADDLAPFVHRYETFEYAGFEPGTHQGLPSRNLTFIVALGDPIDITAMPGSQSPGSYQAFVGGLHARPATIAHNGSGCGISIEVSPLASRALFGVPAAALVWSVVDLAELLGRRGPELVDRLHEQPDWQGRFRVLDDVLGAVLQDRRPPSAEVARAWRLLVRSAGAMRTAEVAREVSYSRRHLTERFSAEFGLTPKVVSRVLRFQHACGLIDAGLTLRTAAAHAGYYDQAHLTNEWRELSGLSPTAWRSDTLRHR